MTAFSPIDGEELRAEPEVIETFLSQSVGTAIHLVAILPDGPTTGQCFYDDAAKAANWAVAQNSQGKNVYWTVNIVNPGVNKKPNGGGPKMENMGDIAAQRFLHVDIDPPKDGSAWDMAEGAAKLDALRYPPSFVLNSGGGLQAFWRLDRDEKSKAAVTQANQGLEGLFAADNCHNHDRLMRVPGTVNYPNKAKRERGRVPSMSSIRVPDDGACYPLDALHAAFTPYSKVRSEKAEKASADIGDDIAPLTADDLGLPALNPLRSLIDHPNGRDRSSDALACAGRMVRDGYSDEQIAGILLNPANAVHAHIGEHRDPRYQVMRIIEKVRADQAEKQEAPEKASAQAIIKATPFQWRDPSAIPLRPWVYGRWFLRGNVTCVVAPGGVGKSTMLAGTALALATGRALLGKTIWDGPKRVWLWNLEDDLDELSRSIQAAAKHFDIVESDIGDRLFVDSAMEGAGLCTATEVGGDFRLLAPVYEALTAELIERKIDVLVVDPFVSSHEVDENANSKIDKVAKAWCRVANAANCVIVLVHHTNKAGGAGEVTALSSRGAVALINAARSTLVLNRMDSDRAEALGIPDDDRRRYFAVEDDKPNRAPAAKADWYRLASVDLGNGGMDGLVPGDSIGVAEPWTVPNPFDDVKPSHLLRIQRIIDEGEYRENPQATDWAGKVVADILDLNVDKKSDKSRIRQLLAGWIDEGALKVEERADKKREIRKWIVVGRWLENTFAAPETGWARQGAAAEQSECPTTTPHFSGVVGCGRSNGENLGAAKSECGSPDPDDVGDPNTWQPGRTVF